MHLLYEDYKNQEYHAVELMPELCERVKEFFPEVAVRQLDCQKDMPYADGYFDRVLAGHVFEHLTNVPAALLEIRRILKPGGILSIVIPCEGTFPIWLARRLSSKPHFEKIYNLPYEPYIKAEHINCPHEIIEESLAIFTLKKSAYYPLRIPWAAFNLLIGLEFV
jgi:SAM-dependent methyltransferase